MEVCAGEANRILSTQGRVASVAGLILEETMPAVKLIANIDYTVCDKNPVVLKPGDEVLVGAQDKAWPGWTWATFPNGRSGYVPQEMLQDIGDGKARMTQEFDARELSVHKGDVVESRQILLGWHWCVKADGSAGWLPGYILRSQV